MKTTCLRQLPWMAFLVLAGCGRSELQGPPELRLGHDECAECGMMINEERCASAAIVEVAGQRRYAMFDDIGCMLDYEHDHRNELRTVDRFLHDHGTKAWIPASTAVVLYAEAGKLQTPMGSGIVAFADAAAAENARVTYGGKLFDYVGLVPARRAWLEARFGEADEPEGRR
ncbi:MAG: nitrous oxide reductase accessory protein NosL [bacterium]|nr:nitrous oxide reductase accessory protein NosL [bacterium]